MNERLTVSAAVQPRVLVVDDDVMFLTFARLVIERMRVRVEVSNTGAAAISRIGSGSWAGVLLDLRLPDVDGLELLRNVREQGNDVPVVIATGAGTVSAAVDAMRLGVEGFLEKPIAQATLVRAVEQLLAADAERTKEEGPPPVEPSARIRALARVIVAFMRAPADARTIEEMCQATGVYVAPRTFRGWCEAAVVRASALHDLARLLRAVGLASSHAAGLRGAMDADERTVRALCDRGFPGVGVAGVPAHPQDLVLRQRFVLNRQLVATIVAILRGDDARRLAG